MDERPPLAVGAGADGGQPAGRRALLEEPCEQVFAAREAVTPLAMESRIPVWLCRGLRRPLTDIWAEEKAFN
jgi:hypothetical protein